MDPAAPGARLRQLRASGDSTRTTSLARIPDELDWIVMRCLEKDRERRYPTAQALAEDILRHLLHEPVEAAPPSATYRLRKLVRRYRVAATTCVLVLVALVLGFIGTSVGLARAEEANAELDAALQQVMAINRFLNLDLLSAVRPSSASGEGHDVLMIDVLDAASARMDKAAAPGGRFADAPLVEASIRFTLGDTYSALGRQPDALAHYDRSLELYRAHSGLGDPATLTCAVERAEALLYLGRAEDARLAIEEVLADLDQTFEPADPVLLLAASVRGQALWREGRHEEAADSLRAKLAEARPLLDTDRPLLDLMSALAIVETERGRLDEAGELFQTVLRRCIELRGEEDPRTLSARRQLGTFLRQAGRLDEARVILEETLEVERRVMGPDHYNTIASMENLAGVLLNMGELDEAERLLDEVVGFFETEFPDHPSAVVALSSLAQLRHRQGRMDEAEVLFRRAYETAERKEGPEHPFTMQHLGNLGALLHYTDRSEEALAIFERTHAAALDGFGWDSLPRLLELQRLATCEIKLGHRESAEAHLLDGLAACGDLPPTHDIPMGLRADLYVIYHGDQRWVEAEPVLAALFEAYLAAGDRRVPATSELLAKLYLRLDRPEDAERVRAQGAQAP